MAHRHRFALRDLSLLIAVLTYIAVSRSWGDGLPIAGPSAYIGNAGFARLW